MKKVLVCLFLGLSLLLNGCSIMNGTYVSVTPHHENRPAAQTEILSADDYLDLMAALTEMIRDGKESATISTTNYPPAAIDSGMAVAIRYATENDPIGSYCVESIQYDVGYSGGQPAVAIQIKYMRNRMEIRQIQHLGNMDQTYRTIQGALERHEPGIVLLVEEYLPTDFPQLVQNIAELNPQLVMEVPQVAAGIYGNGRQRVVELVFTYQNARDALRQMQTQVRPVFESALLYVSGDGSQWQKYTQLYGFLMERFDYTVETSITPAYSLLRHGVGDSRAFATVYAAMCQSAELNCMVITGTRAGIPWTWNIIEDNGYFYHVDLLRCQEQGRFMEKIDSQMQGYVWDYSAYPACVGAPPSDSPTPEPDSDFQESDPSVPETDDVDPNENIGG